MCGWKRARVPVRGSVCGGVCVCVCVCVWGGVCVCVCVCVCVWCDFFFQITLKHTLASPVWGQHRWHFAQWNSAEQLFLVSNIDCMEQGLNLFIPFSKSALVVLSLFLALTVWIHVILFGNVILSFLSAPGCAHEPLNYVGRGSTPPFWWCKVSLHLVPNTHMTVLGAPGFGWGVSGSSSLSQCAYEGRKRRKAKAASSKERVAWSGGVSAKGWAWIIRLRDLEQLFFHWALWQICTFPAQCNPPTTHPLIPALNTPSLYRQTSPNHIYAANPGGTAQI